MVNRIVNEKSSAGAVSIPEAQASRYLGFLEGRLGVALPESWSDSVSRCTMSWSGHVGFAEYAPTHEAGELSTPVPHFSSAEFHRGDLRVSVLTGNYPSTGRDTSVVLPAELADEIRKIEQDWGRSPINEGAIAIENHVYLIAHGLDENHRNGTLVCLRVNDAPRRGEVGVLTWKRPVMDFLPDAYQGNPPLTQFRAYGERVILFHASSASIGIEAYDKEGNQLFRFSSVD